MITVHSLAYSRALRVVWLLEEMGTPYEVVRYDRTDAYKAPPELKRLHPLGKSPLVEIGDLRMAESAAILRHLHALHGSGAFAPRPGTPESARHDEWLHYVEGSFARAVVPAFWARKRGETLDDDSRSTLRSHLDYISQGVEGMGFLCGESLTLADIQISYLLHMAEFGRALGDAPAVAGYLDRLRSRGGFARAVEVTGPVMPPP